MGKNRSRLILFFLMVSCQRASLAGTHAVTSIKGIKTWMPAKLARWHDIGLARGIFIILIKFYQFVISSVMRPCCRFYPTCSQYTLEALQTHSLHKAFFLSIRRILRCHPWHPGGIDLVPPKNREKL